MERRSRAYPLNGNAEPEAAGLGATGDLRPEGEGSRADAGAGKGGYLLEERRDATRHHRHRRRRAPDDEQQREADSSYTWRREKLLEVDE